MKKTAPRNIYDLALAEISDTETAIELTRPNFIHFRKEEKQPVRMSNNKKMISFNQTWTLPSQTYSWFPYFTLYLTSK